MSEPGPRPSFEIDPQGVSSTGIRGGDPFEELVPPAVAALIRERGLYRS